jgi:hypothetical protein
MPLTVASLATTWEQTSHSIKTLYGISKSGYANTPECLLFGPGQGSTIGPFLWLLCFLLILSSLTSSSPRIVIHSVDSSQPITFFGEAFVDDAGLGTDDTTNTTLVTEDQALVSNLNSLAQEWERLLFSTGGALNLQKCFWFLLSWRWNKGRAKLHTQLTLPAQIAMTSGMDPTPSVIKRIEHTDTFRTLGVYLTPDGTCKGAFTVLKEIAFTYASVVTGTHLSHQKALTSYIQYLLPKLHYQPPLLALTAKQCYTLQSIILQALLPKLHINRHTARSIIHGPSELGGLALPQLYTTQGVDKLYLLLGHLRIKDRTGALIHSDLTYLQLLSGSGTFILNQDQKHYRWVEQGWLTSIWAFINSSNLQLVYPNQWVPTLPRQHDQYIMEFFQTLHLSHTTMEQLNRCRLYLQVVTVSDISSACGKYILPMTKTGNIDPARSSTLRWVTQGKPTKADWSIWARSLAHFEQHGRLIQPLGPWIATTHQRWEYFLHPETHIVYFRRDNTQHSYTPIIQPNPRTRQQSRPWYDFHSPTPLLQYPQGPLHPVTLEHDFAITGSLFQVAYSSNPIPQPVHLSQVQPGEQFFAALLALDTNPIPISELNEAATGNSLHIQCGSNYNVERGLTTGTWLFCTTRTLYSYTSSSIPGKTRRRAELTSIMGALYVLTLVNPSFGQVNLSSNNKRALYDALGFEPLGVTLANKPDYDILLEIRRLRTSLTININSYHVSQPNEGVPEHAKALCTPAVECNAYLQSASLANRAALIASMLPSQVITVIHNKEIVLSPLRMMVSQTLHRHPLQQKLQRDNNWTEQQFSLIDWPAYQHAINKHPRCYRISITKLSHSLWNTNQQNCRYYGESSLCSSFKLVTEDTTHIYTCPQPEVVETRTAALAIFETTMRKITPRNVFKSILAGIHQWMANPYLTSYLSPTAGSLLPQLQSITVAFQA